MGKYIITRPIHIGDGFMNNENGELVPMKKLLPQPSTIVEGNIEVRNVLGKDVQGLPYEIKTRVNGELMTSIVMIPQENLELIEEEKREKKNPNFETKVEVKTSEENIVAKIPKTENEVQVTVNENKEEDSEFAIFDLIGYLINN